jgi:hypothetical protein
MSHDGNLLALLFDTALVYAYCIDPKGKRTGLVTKMME